MNTKNTNETRIIRFGSSIRARLAMGFGVIVLVFIASVFINLSQHNQSKKFSEQLIHQDIPSIASLTGVVDQLKSSALKLRNYLLTGDKKLIKDRKESWDNISILSEKINKLSTNWKSTQNVEKWNAIKALLPKMQNLQEKIEVLQSANEKNDIDNQLANAEQVSNELMTLLLGNAAESGMRSGGLLTSLSDQLEIHNAELNSQMQSVVYFQWALLIFGILISIVTVILTTRSIINPIAKAKNHIEKIAAGDLTTRLEISDKSELGDLVQNLNIMTDSLSSITKQINESSHHMSTSLAEVSSAMASQSSGVTEQASAIHEITSTLEELEMSSSQNLEKVRTLGKSAEKTNNETQMGLDSVKKSIAGMHQIRDKVKAIADSILELSNFSQRIGEITSAVSDIAKQSKMLSLNASIEAAKAGEAGRGFSVVAEEVRNLAEQSERSTKQVQQILDDVRSSTEKAVMATEEGTKGVDSGVKLTEHTGATMESLRQVISDTTMACQQLVAASQQESAGIKQITGGMDEINKVTTSFVASVKQTSVAINNLVKISSKLKENVDIYRVK